MSRINKTRICLIFVVLIALPYAFSEVNGSINESINDTYLPLNDIINQTNNTPPEIILLYPTNDTFVTTHNVVFRFTADANIICNLYANDNVMESGIPVNSIQTEISKQLPEGPFSWKLSCLDNQSNIYESDAENFKVDYSSPEIALHTPNEINSTGTMYFNFSVTDTFDDVLDCNITVNMQSNVSLVAENNTPVVTQMNFAEGPYFWLVRCRDDAGHATESEARTFYIKNEMFEFEVRNIKDNYNLGENSYFLINAPDNSNLTIFITTPKDLFVRKYSTRSYPDYELMDFLYYPGSYTIEAILFYSDETKTERATFSVTNTMDLIIDINETTVNEGATLNFNAQATGGIGSYNYSWSFGDGTMAGGQQVSHAYPLKGKYKVRVIATDSKSNQVTKEITANVKREVEVKIVAIDSSTKSPIRNADVNLNSGSNSVMSTNDNGEAVFRISAGSYSLEILAGDYYPFMQDVSLEISETRTFELQPIPKKTGASSSPDEENSSIGQNQEPEQNEEEPKPAGETSPPEITESDKVFESDNEIDLLLDQINSAMIDAEGFDSKQTAVSELLKVVPTLKGSKKSLEMANRDIQGLGRLMGSESEKDKRKEEIQSVVDVVKENTIVGIEVLAAEEYVSYNKPSDLDSVLADYLANKSISIHVKKDLIQELIDFEAKFRVTTELGVVKVKYLSGKDKTVSIVSRSLEGKNVSDKTIMEFIPKDVARDASNIKSFSDFIIIKSDPVISFSNSDEIVYFIEDEIDAAKLKTIKSIILPDQKFIDDYLGKITSVTGFSIFGEIGRVFSKTVLEILAVIVLLVTYLTFQFELPSKLKEGELLASQEIKTINKMIKEAYLHIELKQFDNAFYVYEDINKGFRSLAPTDRTRILEKTKELYHNLTVAKINQLHSLANEHISQGSREKAVGHYHEIKQHYDRLPKEYQAQVGKKNIELFNRLKG